MRLKEIVDWFCIRKLWRPVGITIGKFALLIRK